MPIGLTDYLSALGAFHLLEDTDLKGGYRIVANTAERDAIATASRKEGMRAYVIASGNTFQLGAGLGNGDWVLDAGDADAIHDNVAGEITAITLKGSPVGGDVIVIEDSEDSNNKKRATIGSLPSGGSGQITYVTTVDAARVVNVSTTAQPIGDPGKEAVTLAAGSYAFRGRVHLQENAGGGSRALRLGWGGTATISACGYHGRSWRNVRTPNIPSTITLSTMWMTTSAHTSVTTSGNSGEFSVVFEGSLVLSAGGTLIPELSFSNTQAMTHVLVQGSYVEISLASATGWS